MGSGASKDPNDYLITVAELGHIVGLGHKAYEEGRLTVPEEAAKVPEDPHGLVEFFAAHLEVSLRTMHPAEAARAAMKSLDAFLEHSQFISLSHKGSSGPQYVRRDREPSKGGGAVR